MRDSNEYVEPFRLHVLALTRIPTHDISLSEWGRVGVHLVYYHGVLIRFTSSAITKS